MKPKSEWNLEISEYLSEILSTAAGSESLYEIPFEHSSTIVMACIQDLMKAESIPGDFYSIHDAYGKLLTIGLDAGGNIWTPLGLGLNLLPLYLGLPKNEPLIFTPIELNLEETLKEHSIQYKVYQNSKRRRIDPNHLVFLEISDKINSISIESGVVFEATSESLGDIKNHLETIHHPDLTFQTKQLKNLPVIGEPWLKNQAVRIRTEFSDIQALSEIENESAFFNHILKKFESIVVKMSSLFDNPTEKIVVLNNNFNGFKVKPSVLNLNLKSKNNQQIWLEFLSLENLAMSPHFYGLKDIKKKNQKNVTLDFTQGFLRGGYFRVQNPTITSHYIPSREKFEESINKSSGVIYFNDSQKIETFFAKNIPEIQNLNKIVFEKKLAQKLVSKTSSIPLKPRL